jgi:hypothetical protein
MSSSEFVALAILATHKVVDPKVFSRVIEALVIAGIAAFAGSTYALHKSTFSDGARIDAIEKQFVVHITRQADDRRAMEAKLDKIDTNQIYIIQTLAKWEATHDIGQQGVQGVQGVQGRQGIQGQRGKQ